MPSVKSLIGLAAIFPILTSAISTYNATFHTSPGCGDSTPYSMNGSRYTDCAKSTIQSVLLKMRQAMKPDLLPWLANRLCAQPNGYCHFFLFSDTACAVEITTEDNLDGVCENVSGIQSFRAGQDIIFYVTKDYAISYYTSRDPDEVHGQQYDRSTLKVSGNTIRVNKALPIIAAVAYTNPNPCAAGGLGDDEIRVYYVDADSFTLRELKRSGPPSPNTWQYGQEFIGKNLDIYQHSGLTANVVPVNNKHQLKVYYEKRDEQLSVAYRVLGTEDWSIRNDVTN
ncbi:unnamed protein product [Clonostachys solani]|uniref:Fucose-specific lectin n=1 Tax=Clonostachys solani TaxID=160281 RepID=A0A9N9YUT9_9HYPO|nr:unnamed protein product [Clonostachys solani]